jgi:dynein heavy chain
VEDALRNTVKKSLQELSRLLNGDKKTEVIPIFNVMVFLETKNRVELRPNVQDIFNMIHNVSRELITVVSHVPRLIDIKDHEEGKSPALPSFYDSISTDEDTTLKIIVSITTGEAYVP